LLRARDFQCNFHNSQAEQHTHTHTHTHTANEAHAIAFHCMCLSALRIEIFPSPRCSFYLFAAFFSTKSRWHSKVKNEHIGLRALDLGWRRQ